MALTAQPDSASDVRWRIDQLLRAEAFAHPVAHLELRETLLSWIVLTGAFAYKIKKPIKLEFVDASSLAQRRHFCEEEIRLNRRLAPELYGKVVPIRLIEGLPRVDTAAGTLVDYAVCMRQFDRADELGALLRHADVALAEVTDLAERLALFHMAAPVAPGGNESTERMYDTVFSNLAELADSLPVSEPSARLERLSEWLRERASALESTLLTREQQACIRECHGDLHAGNVVRWQGHLVPFDCIEFDPRLRWIDVLDDLAFLVMDLVSHDCADLATALLSRYLEITGDYTGVRVVPFYAVHRALVRAKVDAIAARQSQPRRMEYQQRLQRRIQAAISWLDRPRPLLILMHGPSGSGKSWLSERLVPLVPALRIRSDVERKRFVSGTATSDLHSAQTNHRTYARLLDCAESGLEAGFNVIVDATFLDAADRELFRGLAARLQTALAIVSCGADAPTLARRIRERASRSLDPSDADHGVLDEQLRSLQPFGANELPEVIAADTRHALVVRNVTRALQERALPLID